jgi:hypothetical protein
MDHARNQQKRAGSYAWFAACYCKFPSSLTLQPRRWRCYVPPKRRPVFAHYKALTTQRTVLLISSLREFQIQQTQFCLVAYRRPCNISMALQSFGPWPLFHYLIPHIVGRTPWKGDQPVPRPLPTCKATQTQNKRTETYMPRVGFEHTIPVFEH